METSLTTWFFANGSRKRVSSTSSTTVRRVSHFVSFHMVCSRVSACACHGLLCVRRPRNQDVVCHVSISRRARIAPGLLATPALVPQSSDGGILTTQILLIFGTKNTVWHTIATAEQNSGFTPWTNNSFISQCLPVDPLGKKKDKAHQFAPQHNGTLKSQRFEFSGSFSDTCRATFPQPSNQEI